MTDIHELTDISIPEMKKLADGGDVSAQFTLGGIYEHGGKVKRNLRLAKKYYEMAANRGDTLAQLALAFLYSGTNGIERNFKKALYWFEKAASQGDVIGQMNLAEFYQNGKGTEKDLRKAFDLYKYVSEKSNVSGYVPLAKMYWEGLGTEKDISKAKYWLEKGARRNHPASILNLIFLLTHSGEGSDRFKEARGWLEKLWPENDAPLFRFSLLNRPGNLDLWGKDKKILHWFLSQAEAEDTEAQLCLIFLIEHEVIEIDKRIVACLENSGAPASPEANYLLGKAYFYGKGVEKDYKKAERYLLAASEDSVGDAYFELANLYKNAIHDYTKALPYIHKAIEHGDMDAYFQLGNLYEEGLGVEKDFNKAKYYFQQATQNPRCIPLAHYFIGQLYEKGAPKFPKNMEKAIEHYKDAAEDGLDAAIGKLINLDVEPPERGMFRSAFQKWAKYR